MFKRSANYKYQVYEANVIYETRKASAPRNYMLPVGTCF